MDKHLTLDKAIQELAVAEKIYKKEVEKLERECTAIAQEFQEYVAPCYSISTLSSFMTLCFFSAIDILSFSFLSVVLVSLDLEVNSVKVPNQPFEGVNEAALASDLQVILTLRTGSSGHNVFCLSRMLTVPIL